MKRLLCLLAVLLIFGMLLACTAEAGHPSVARIVSRSCDVQQIQQVQAYTAPVQQLQVQAYTAPAQQLLQVEAPVARVIYAPQQQVQVQQLVTPVVQRQVLLQQVQPVYAQSQQVLQLRSHASNSLQLQVHANDGRRRLFQRDTTVVRIRNN